MRRTANVDMIVPIVDGTPQVPGPLTLRASARDLLTTEDGHSTVAEARMRAEVSKERRLQEIVMTPEAAPSELRDAFVGPGYRNIAIQARPDWMGTLDGMLLLDLPGCALISGFIRRKQEMDLPASQSVPGHPMRMRMANICSGWREGGFALSRSESKNAPPDHECPPALSLATDDPLAYHDMKPLGPQQMRRLRRIDITAQADGLALDAYHRDTYAELDGTEIVVHEYTVTGRVHPKTFELEELEAVARVLPFPECSLATETAARFIGISTENAISGILERLRGIHGCTHLSDLLSNFVGIPRMAKFLRSDRQGY